MITKENSNIHKKRKQIYPNNFQKIVRDSKETAKRFIFKVQEKVNNNSISLIVIATWRRKYLVIPQFSPIDPNKQHNANGYILRYKGQDYTFTTFDKICEKIREINNAKPR
jgi:hypothetical protein